VEFRSGIVHRLDKDTSGILLVAKTQEAFENLQEQFKDRRVKKTYVALVHGRLFPGSGEVQTSVGRLPWRRDRFGIIPGGRESRTRYSVTGYYKMQNVTNLLLKDYSLVEFYPETGRTHQIRIHAKYLGNPIVGDIFYAGRKTAKVDLGWCPRLFLHASSISLKSPATNETIFVKSELPKELKEALNLLEKQP